MNSVGVAQGGGSEKRLTRALTSAELVRVPGGVGNAIETLRSGKADVWASNPGTIQTIADGLPGSKVVPGAYSTARYAAGLPKGRSAAAQRRLAEIISEAKRTGVVQKAIERAVSRAFELRQINLGGSAMRYLPVLVMVPR